MTTLELNSYIGRCGTWTTAAGAGFLKIEVVVKDAKTAFGRIDLQIAPRTGSGTAWVSASSVVLETAPKTIDRPKPRP